jgi:hypothetical protein
MRILSSWTSLMGLARKAQPDVHQSTLPANDFHYKFRFHFLHYPLSLPLSGALYGGWVGPSPFTATNNASQPRLLAPSLVDPNSGPLFRALFHYSHAASFGQESLSPQTQSQAPHFPHRPPHSPKAASPGLSLLSLSLSLSE